MASVIRLGTPGALRNYTLLQQGDGIAWDSSPAFPFSAKVNTSNQYDEVDSWNEWVQEDWQQGVGRVDPQAGGFLFAQAETRVPNQVILPPLLQQADLREITGAITDCRYMPDNVAGTVTVGAGGHEAVAIKVTLPDVYFDNFHFLGRIPLGTSVRLSLYTDSAGSPGTEHGPSVYTITGGSSDDGLHWCGTNMGVGSGLSGTYWVRIAPTSPSDTIEVACGTSGYAVVAKSYNGSSWANIASTYLVYSTNLFALETEHGYVSFVRFNGKLYAIKILTSSFLVYEFIEGDNNFVLVDGAAGVLKSMVVFGPYIYFGLSNDNFFTMDTSEVLVEDVVERKLFLDYKGLLYGTWQGSIYYSNDGLTWSGPFAVCGGDNDIRGLAGMGDSVYMATDKALLRLAPGDVVEEVTRFGSESDTNGVGMVEYQGKLYIPASGRLFVFDPSGEMVDVWISRDDDLPASQIGGVEALARMNNWLIAHTASPNMGERSSLWALQDGSWHFLAELPQRTSATAINIGFSALYDRESSRLWFSSKNQGPYYIEIDDFTVNPFNSDTYKYFPTGWIEQDRFYGGQYLLNKDWESVWVIGENISANVNVKIYWQDEDSTDWELLGTATGEQELRWEAPYTTRPAGKWIKLAAMLSTNDGDETPRVRAIVVKFLPKTVTKIQDNVTIPLKDYIQMPDGTPDIYTAAQQWTHIKSLIDSVAPIIYEDPSGVQYEVQVTTWSRKATIFAYEGGANNIKEYTVMLTLRQVNDDLYVA